MNLNLHPDDLLFFNEVAGAMRRVAKKYDLPLTGIEPYTMPQAGMADRLGDCSTTGKIRMVMRCTVDGQWCEEPLSPGNIWDTAAHELSHLRHFPHGQAHSLFQEELREALSHQQEDHKAKVLARLVKMQAARQGEAALGNTDAAEAFAAAINRMLIEYELKPSDIDYARSTDHDPVLEIMVDLSKYRIEKKKSRVAWQETLARVVADAHLCSFLIRQGSNHIWFVGTRSHAEVAEYVYGTLIYAADKLCTTAYYHYLNRTRYYHEPRHAGFRAAWFDAFVGRINERFREARDAAVAAAAPDVPGGQSTALIRLNGALLKTRKYIDDKFQHRRTAAKSLGHRSRKSHEEGRRMGRAAAEAMTIGRKALTS